MNLNFNFQTAAAYEGQGRRLSGQDHLPPPTPTRMTIFVCFYMLGLKEKTLFKERLLLKKVTLYLHIFRDGTRFKCTVVDI